MGVQFSNENGSQNFPYVVTNSSSWVYGSTDFTDGSSVPGIVGYEWDRFDSNYPPPPAVAGSWTLLGNSPTVTDAGRADSKSHQFTRRRAEPGYLLPERCHGLRD